MVKHLDFQASCMHAAFRPGVHSVFEASVPNLGAEQHNAKTL